MNQVPEVIRLTIAKSLKMLTSIAGCSFKVRFPDGQIILHDPTNSLDENRQGRLVKKRNYRNPGIPHGGLQHYIKGFVDNLKPGDVRSIPFTDPDTKITFNGVSLASSTSSYMAKTYGSGNYTTFRNDVNRCVEVYLGVMENE